MRPFPFFFEWTGENSIEVGEAWLIPSWKTRFHRQVNYNNLLTSSHRFPPVLRYGHVGYVKHGGGKVWLDAAPRRSGLPQHVGVIPNILWRSHKIGFPSQIGFVSRNRILNFSVSPAIHCHQPEGLGSVNPSCPSPELPASQLTWSAKHGSLWPFFLFKGDSNKSIESFPPQKTFIMFEQDIWGRSHKIPINTWNPLMNPLLWLVSGPRFKPQNDRALFLHTTLHFAPKIPRRFLAGHLGNEPQDT